MTAIVLGAKLNPNDSTWEIRETPYRLVMNLKKSRRLHGQPRNNGIKITLKR